MIAIKSAVSLDLVIYHHFLWKVGIHAQKNLLFVNKIPDSLRQALLDGYSQNQSVFDSMIAQSEFDDFVDLYKMNRFQIIADKGLILSAAFSFSPS